MTGEELLALLLYGAAVSFTPGPNTTLSAALGANGGLARALPFAFAVPVGWSLMFLLCTLGLGVIVSRPEIRTFLLLAAGGYMLWLAWVIGRRRTLGQADGRRLDVGFFQGVALQFVNGKAWLNAVTVSATWVAVGPDIWARLRWVLPILLAYAFLSNFTYAVVGSVLRQWLSVGERLLWFNRALALLLVGTAAWVLGQAL
ncbi:MAG TPA: LysE family transporter [Ramlibacter sp.]|nr:LysE family transporter [Ramlibacter sp.]